ncbi:head fiber protein [Bacteroides sp.]|uniref:head fiber protein n=1 Tax=Bacteroides sp. TaxID=29523 RepID=UPI002625449E|nr:head fiber protein [Bacteroides sp.]MDD3038624.1 head fiber protein [Bacteroides sp.]
MAAGTHYELKPDYKPEEFYRVETGVRKSGPWKLDITNLVIGSTLPVFTPVQADLKKRTLVPVRNVKVIEAYTTGETALSIKIKKDSLAYVGMFIGNGKKGAEVTAIDKTNKAYDVLTIKAAFGENIAKDAVLFEAAKVDGTAKKNTANFVMYDEKKVESNGAVLCTLLMQAYEVKEGKLVLPIHELDKVGLTSRFQFEY